MMWVDVGLTCSMRRSDFTEAPSRTSHARANHQRLVSIAFSRSAVCGTAVLLNGSMEPALSRRVPVDECSTWTSLAAKMEESRFDGSTMTILTGLGFLRRTGKTEITTDSAGIGPNRASGLRDPLCLPSGSPECGRPIVGGRWPTALENYPISEWYPISVVSNFKWYPISGGIRFRVVHFGVVSNF